MNNDHVTIEDSYFVQTVRIDGVRYRIWERDDDVTRGVIPAVARSDDGTWVRVSEPTAAWVIATYNRTIGVSS
jgi:hypothetical protein